MTTQRIKVHPAEEKNRLGNGSSQGEATLHVKTKTENRPRTARERITKFIADHRPFSSKKRQLHTADASSSTTETDWKADILCYCKCKAFKAPGKKKTSKSGRPSVNEDGGTTGPEICECGHLGADHGDLDDDTACKPAHGEVQFVGHTKTAKYARVSSDAVNHMEGVWRLITEEWNLSPPSLVISVVGGSKNFRLKARLEEAFRQGLRSAARQSGAWITSTGLHRGVMKQAGRVVRDCGLTSESRVTAIGIAPWSCVNNRDLLMKNDGTKVVEYQVSEIEHDTETTSLDPNHTHFLFLDDSKRGTAPHYGSEIDFRIALENYISDNAIAYEASGGKETVQVAVTMLVVEGGVNTLKTVDKAIKENIPVILIKGSGKCADILAEAQQANNHTHGVRGLTSKADTIKDRIQRSFPKEEDKVNRLVTSCIREDATRKMMSVFHVDPHVRSSHDLDVAILRAFLTAKQLSVKKKMELAIAWNRVDVARNEIMADIDLTDTSVGNSEGHRQSTTDLPPTRRDLHGLLKMSIEKRHRAEFVELLLEHDVSLKEFLRDEALFSPLQKSKSKEKITPYLRKTEDDDNDSVLLAEEGENEDDDNSSSDEESERRGCMKVCCRRQKNSALLETTAATGEATEDKCLALLYEHTKALGTKKDDRDIKERISSRVKKLLGSFYKKPKYPDTKEETAQRLFIWAVLSGRFDLAKVFLKEATDTMGAALMAVALIKATRKRYDRSSVEEINRLDSQAKEFEDLAIGVLNACYADNEKKTRKVLKRELPVWGRSSCILLAMKADTKRFLAQPACQAFINFIWMDEIFVHTNRMVKMLLSMILVVIIPTAVKFRKEEKSKTEKKTSDGSEKRIPALKKIGIFYHTPMVIFCLNFMSYAAFLCLYSYILLIQLSSEWHYLESLLAIWVLTIFMEEVRQFTPFSSSRSGSVRNKWKNSLDIIAFIGFVTGGILRILSLYVCNACLDWARLTLAANVIPCFFRLLVFYTINKELGPKLVMIRRMVHDLMWFVVILLVFVASYAVASESILYPNAQLSWQFLFHLPRKAYWQIYGELFLEDIEGDSDCTDNPELYSDYSEQRCPSDLGQYAVPVLTGLYVMLTNILLVNLLIAMFSYTFQQVQENTDTHWHCQRFNLIFEYAERPDFPPPLNIFIYIFWILTGKKHESRFRKRVDEKKVRKRLEKEKPAPQSEAKTDKEKQAENYRAHKLREALAKLEKKKRKDAQLVEWEKLIADGFFISVKEKESLDNKVDTMRQHIEDLQMKVDFLTEYHARLNRLASLQDSPEEDSKLPIKSASGDTHTRPSAKDTSRSKQSSESSQTSDTSRAKAASSSNRQLARRETTGPNSRKRTSLPKPNLPSTSAADDLQMPPPAATSDTPDSAEILPSAPTDEDVPEAPVYYAASDSSETSHPLPGLVLAEGLVEAEQVDVSVQLQSLQQQILQSQESHFSMMSERFKALEEQMSKLSN